MTKINALLVGINNYHPESQVRALLGCNNDVARMENFLRAHYSGAEILSLCDEGATRSALIKALRDFAGTTQAGETFLFHFAGHGSTAPSAPEFAAAGQSDETLVCYDSRLPEGFDLADKEIAALLAGFKPDVEIVLIFDSCHSGSASRDDDPEENLRLRFQAGSKTPRALKDYLDGYYLGKATVALEVPRTPHILLAACRPDQKAAETPKRDHGTFSKALLDVLEASAGKISYRQLFSKVKPAICTASAMQTPQFDIFEGFNANSVFLQRNVIDERRYYTYFDTRQMHWQVNLGAVHGLPTNAAGLGILLHPEKNHPDQTPVPATIDRVMMNYCVLKDPSLSRNRAFSAELTGLPQPTMCVWLNGSLELRERFVALLTSLNPFYEWVNQPGSATYELRLEDQEMAIYHRSTGRLLHGVRGFDERAVQYIASTLGKMEHWERMGALRQDPSTGLDTGVEIWFETVDEHGEWRRQNGREIQMTYRNSQKIPARIMASNHSDRNWYVVLLSLSRKFQVSSKLNDQYELPAKSKNVELLSDRYFIGDENIQEALDLYKVIFSREPVDNTMFNQPKIELGQIVEIDRNAAIGDVFRDSESEEGPQEHWFLHTLALRTVRDAGTLAVGMKRGALQIDPHPVLKATLRVTNPESHTRGFSDTQHLAERLAEQGLELLSLNPASRDAGAENLVQLSDVSNFPEKGLLETPLSMTLSPDALKGGKTIPLAFDGEFIVPFGEVEYPEDGSARILAQQIPLPGEDKEGRNIGRALWFGFLRVTVKAEEKVFLLREVAYEGKKIRYDTTGLPEKVSKSTDIILVLHGIIGNTKDKAEALRFAAYGSGKYDLVLAFDYENLATPISEIALILDKKLQEIGLGPNHGKKLSIVAHSMGGLVSRYLLEKLHMGESFAEILYLFGTPNGGSRFGKIPSALRIGRLLLGLALNLTGGQAQEVLQWMNGILSAVPDQAFVTLEMMAPDSAFLKELAQSQRPVGTRYLVIAGSIRSIDNAATDGFFKRLTERLFIGAGALVYFDQDSDIAVGVESVLAVPFLDRATESRIIPAHHLNYFSDNPGQAVLKEYL